MRIFSLAFLILYSSLAVSLQESSSEQYVFDTNEKEELFRKLSEELRCLVCQNQSLSDSNAGLANDLRIEIHQMINDGKTEDEIISFMVDRYGDFVLYRPPLKPLTWLLWFSPFIALIIGFVIVKNILKQQKLVVNEAELTAYEKDRLENLRSEIEYKAAKNKKQNSKGSGL